MKTKMAITLFFGALVLQQAQAQPNPNQRRMVHLLESEQYDQVVAEGVALYEGAESNWLLPYLGEAEFQRKNYDKTIYYLENIPEQERSEEIRSFLGWAYYYQGDPAASLELFQELVKDEPRSVDALTGAGWSLYALERYAEGAEYFRSALRVAPAHPYSVSGLNACNDMLADGETVPLIDEHRRYSFIKYFATYTLYDGSTAKNEGLSQDVLLETGRVGKNYLNLLFSYSQIDTDSGTPTFKQTEIRSSGGVVVDGVLFRGTVGYLDLDDTPEEGVLVTTTDDATAWLFGVGVETMEWKVNPFLDLYGFFGTDADVYQTVPGISSRIWNLDLRSSVEFGFYDPDNRDSEATAYFQQSATWYPTASTALYGGFGAGESYYGMRAPGGVFFSLPDKRKADAWLQWSIDFNPWWLAVGANYSSFESNAGSDYNAYGAMLSIGYNWDGIPGN